MSKISETRMLQDANATTAVTAALVKRAHSISQGDLSPEAREIARHCILDWVGAALAGAQEPLVTILKSQALEEGGSATVSLIGGGAKASVRQAALINGAAGHAIDYDDTNVASHGHVTAGVLPAALAIAEARALSGDALMLAFAAGYEMTCMVGQYLGRAHYEQGFHGTSTVGCFGAACAASILLGLDELATAVALGVAGTQAGGVKAQFGTMCKPLHAGKAAENGVIGAQLVSRGFTGRPDLLEAPQGFGTATSPAPSAAAALAVPASGSYLHQNLFKYHAACYGTHASIEAVTAIVLKHRLTVREIERIELDVDAGTERMCNIPAPRTGLEAKFSLRFNAALAVAGFDTSAPSTYSDNTAISADLVALRDRVTVRFMPATWPLMVAEARIHTRDGRMLTMKHDSSIPEVNLGHQQERLIQKFMALASPVVGQVRAEDIFHIISDIEQIEDVSILMSLLRTT